MNFPESSLTSRFVFYGGAVPALLIGLILIGAGLFFIPASQRPTSGIADLGPSFAALFAIFLIPTGVFVAGLAITSRLPLRWVAVPSSYLSLGLGLLWVAGALGYGLSQLQIIEGVAAALPGGLFLLTGATGLLGWSSERLLIPSGRTMLLAIGLSVAVAMVCGLVSGIVWRTSRVVLAAEGGDIRQAVWLPQQAGVLSVDENGRLQQWSTVEGEAPTLVAELNGWQRGAAVSPNGRLLAVQLTEGVALLETESWAQTALLPVEAESRFQLQWSPDGTTLAAAGTRTIALWAASSGTLLHTLVPPDNDSVRELAWSPDGQQLVAITGMGNLTFWDAQTGERRASWPIYGRLGDVTWSSDGRYAITQKISSLSLIDPATGEVVGDWPLGDLSNVEQLVWSPDGGTLAVSSSNGEIELLDGENGRLQQTLGETDNRIVGISWSSDSQQLVSLDHRGNLVVWFVG